MSKKMPFLLRLSLFEFEDLFRIRAGQVLEKAKLISENFVIHPILIFKLALAVALESGEILHPVIRKKVSYQ